MNADNCRYCNERLHPNNGVWLDDTQDSYCPAITCDPNMTHSLLKENLDHLDPDEVRALRNISLEGRRS